MFETLFGAEMPLVVRFFLAFLIVLGLIGATAWAVRRFGSGRLGGAGARGRQPRLAVIDHASVDGRRRLILVRRDNIEHLLMIGGPTDVVVEANIVRAAPATRDVTVPRPPAATDALPRAIPLPDNGSSGSWPLQPEPAAPVAPMIPARPLPRIEPLAEEPPPQQAELPRPQRETLAALADEIATRPLSPPTRGRPAAPVRARPVEPKAEPRIEARAEARIEPRPPGAKPADAETAAAADQSLAEMAHRLEAALRKPKAPGEVRPPAPPLRAGQPDQTPETDGAAPSSLAAARSAPQQPRPAPPSETKPAGAAGGPSQGRAASSDNFEQELASLLGRQAGKT